MWLKRHVFTLAVIGTGILVAATFYLGQRSSSDDPARRTGEAKAYIDSVYGEGTTEEHATTVSETSGQQRSATVSIRTQPPGARIAIESDTIGRSPIDEYRTRAGVLFLSLEKRSYAPVDTILITEANQHLTASFDLSPTDDTASESSSGDNTNGTTGEAPATDGEPVSNGTPDIASTSPSQQPTRTESSAASPSPAPETPEETTGTFRVTSTPSGASLWIDGAHAGTTPTTIPDLSPGSYRVSVEQTGYEPLHTTVNIEPGNTETIDAALTRSTGTLNVLVKPWGSIYIDGELHKSDTDLQYTTQLPSGEHRVRLEHPELGVWQGSVVISAGTSQDTVIDLTEVDTRQPE